MPNSGDIDSFFGALANIVNSLIGGGSSDLGLGGGGTVTPTPEV
ncbi:hypothetical protein [Rhodococcus kronopolitis]|uniref:Uncharacterized protein n=1 Tax=Rhodococcus kronopolitis TaxID=1460226 RepID=A0ABV9FXN3_9NOCA